MRLNRKSNELRNIKLEPGCNRYAEGSCTITMGNTIVLCTASIEDKVPYFLRHTGSGWIHAEYSMLPRSTHARMQREITKGTQGGRSHEIQRLIGRSLRSCLDLKMLGERQIIIDCDVLQADGGTRVASITGGYVALHYAIKKLIKDNILRKNPIISQVAAISVGIINGSIALDLEYSEDSIASVDSNFVMNNYGHFIEVQSSAEHHSFSIEQLNNMITLAKQGIEQLIIQQKTAIETIKN